MTFYKNSKNVHTTLLVSAHCNRDVAFIHQALLSDTWNCCPNPATWALMERLEGNCVSALFVLASSL